MREHDILYQNGPAWVKADRKIGAYVVMVDGAVHATSDSAYALDSDGLSIAKARCDYLAKQAAKPTDPKCQACGMRLSAANAGKPECAETNNYEHDFPGYSMHVTLTAVDPEST